MSAMEANPKPKAPATPASAAPMPKESELMRSALMPMIKAASRSISTARMALPVRVLRRNQKMPTEASTLPVAATNLGILSAMPETSHVPDNRVCPMVRKSGVQIRAARFDRKMLTPNVTTSWASGGPFITLLMMNR